MIDKKEFVQFMLDSGVLTFGDFVTKSGRRTPYFINTGNYRTGSQLHRLGGYYAKLIAEVGIPQALFGPAYKGIPLASVTAAALWEKYHRDVLYCFNRKEAKDHGEGGSLVGAKLEAGQKVAIIEDVITAGTAVRETLPILQAAGVTVTDMFISCDRMERGQGGGTAVAEVKAAFGITVHPIVTVRDILEAISPSPEADAMVAYMKQYCVL